MKNHFLKTVKIRLFDRPFFKLCECMKFMKVKRSENLDAKQLARIDKMWNDGNPEVRTSEKVEIK